MRLLQVETTRFPAKTFGKAAHSEVSRQNYRRYFGVGLTFLGGLIGAIGLTWADTRCMAPFACIPEDLACRTLAKYQPVCVTNYPLLWTIIPGGLLASVGIVEGFVRPTGRSWRQTFSRHWRRLLAYGLLVSLLVGYTLVLRDFGDKHIICIESQGVCLGKYGYSPLWLKEGRESIPIPEYWNLPLLPLQGLERLIALYAYSRPILQLGIGLGTISITETTKRLTRILRQGSPDSIPTG